MDTGSDDGGSTASTGEAFVCEAPRDYTCNVPTYPVPGTRPLPVIGPETVVIDAGRACCSAPLSYRPSIGLLGGDAFQAIIYRPDVPPETPLPMVLFVRAAGAMPEDGTAVRTEYSETLFSTIAARGALVVGLDVGGTGPSVPSKVAALTCAVRWLQVEHVDHASCDVVLMGHSAGGHAAWEAGRIRRETYASYWGDAELRALVLLAAGTSAARIPYAPGDQVPLIAIGGSTDEDQKGTSLHWYSLMFPEPATERDAGKALVWVYAFDHYAWGGLTPTAALGEQVAGDYVGAFLDREVAGQRRIEDWHVLSGRAFPDAVLAPGGDPDFWARIPGFDAYADLDCRTVPDASACRGTDGCYWAAAMDSCVHRPMVFTAVTPSRASGDLRHTIADFESTTLYATEDLTASQVTIAPILDLVQPYTVPTTAHGHENYDGGTAMRIAWNGARPPGAVRFAIDPPVPVNDAAMLSFRAANLLEMTGTTATACTAAHTEPLHVEVELVPSEGIPRALAVPPLVQQDFRTTTLMGADTCNHQIMLQTIQLPLAAFCTQGSFAGKLTEVVFRFPEQPELATDVAMLLDGIELTRTPEDVADGARCAP